MTLDSVFFSKLSLTPRSRPAAHDKATSPLEGPQLESTDAHLLRICTLRTSHWVWNLRRCSITAYCIKYLKGKCIPLGCSGSVFGTDLKENTVIKHEGGESPKQNNWQVSMFKGNRLNIFQILHCLIKFYFSAFFCAFNCFFHFCQILVGRICM